MSAPAFSRKAVFLLLRHRLTVTAADRWRGLDSSCHIGHLILLNTVFYITNFILMDNINCASSKVCGAWPWRTAGRAPRAGGHGPRAAGRRGANEWISNKFMASSDEDLEEQLLGNHKNEDLVQIDISPDDFEQVCKLLITIF